MPLHQAPQFHSPRRKGLLHRPADIVLDRDEEAAHALTLGSWRPPAQARAQWGPSQWLVEEARRISGCSVESHASGGRFEVLEEPLDVVAALLGGNFAAVLLARAVAPTLDPARTLIACPQAKCWAPPC